MTALIDPRTLKQWLHDTGEIALLDVREHGQFGEAHLFYAVPLPYSRFEIELDRLVPRRDVRLVLCDDGRTGVAELAAKRAESCGYGNVHILDGGVAAWREAGFELFAGVNVVSKTFGELIEHANDVPSISADQLQARLARGEEIVVVDGRPVDEYRKMNIPGSICCPNGELAYRIGAIAPSADTTVVVNCAGRTRSIIGAETLRRFGIANRVMALENGTMGWRLAGLELEHGSDRIYPPAPREQLDALRARAVALASQFGVARIGPEKVQEWLAEPDRTTYLLDVRTPEEFAADHLPGAILAPGGQLVQATDHWLAVRGGRIVLVDDNEIRAIVIATWLSEMGWDVHALEGGLDAGRGIVSADKPKGAAGLVPDLPLVDVSALADAMASSAILDVRPSRAYRSGHLDGAVWAIRPRLAVAPEVTGGRPVILIADRPEVAQLAALDLAEAGTEVAGVHVGGPALWRANGLAVTASPDRPTDGEAIDYLLFTHDRHDGNLDAARQYLAWETSLVERIDAAERESFRIIGRAAASGRS